ELCFTNKSCVTVSSESPFCSSPVTASDGTPNDWASGPASARTVSETAARATRGALAEARAHKITTSGMAMIRDFECMSYLVFFEFARGSRTRARSLLDGIVGKRYCTAFGPGREVIRTARTDGKSRIAARATPRNSGDSVGWIRALYADILYGERTGNLEADQGTKSPEQMR